MIENVVKDCFPFLFLSIVILLGFGFSLFGVFTLMQVDQNDWNELADKIEISFGSPWKSILTMFYAMAGTFDQEVNNNHHFKSVPVLNTDLFRYSISMDINSISLLSSLLFISSSRPLFYSTCL